MSGYIDLNYISKIQPRLQQFKKKRDYLFNFRCPVCGDSKKSKTKASVNEKTLQLFKLEIEEIKIKNKNPLGG